MRVANNNGRALASIKGNVLFDKIIRSTSSVYQRVVSVKGENGAPYFPNRRAGSLNVGVRNRESWLLSQGL